MKHFVAILLLLLGITEAGGQGTPCGFDHLLKNNPNRYAAEDLFFDDLKKWRQQGGMPREYPNPFVPIQCDYCLQIDPGLKQVKFVVPIVIHVVHLPGDSIIGTGSNISPEQIENQIEQLNKYFANVGGGPKSKNTGIQFCLAPVGPNNDGIIRYSSSMSNHAIGDYNAFLALNTTLSQDKFLHIFTCNNIVTDTAVKGYSSTFGDKYQGVVIEYKRFGKYEQGNSDINVHSASRGKVLVHEVGHFLGLYHTFHDGCKGMTADSCHLEGDRCCDTPPVKDPNSGCSSQNNSCNERYGKDRIDQTENYMDYAGEDCQNTFTHDQTEIMHFMLLKKRTALVDPVHVNNIQLACATFSAFFKPASSAVCQKDTVGFNALQYPVLDSAIYEWKIKNANASWDTTISGYNLYTFKIKLRFVGYHDVILKLTKGTNFISDTLINAVLAQNCGTPRASNQGNWYFGRWTGINFANNGIYVSDKAIRATPKPTINTEEGTITQSTNDGRLLFYAGGYAEMGTNGLPSSDTLFVYGKNHRQMPNGILKGSSSSMQTGIVIPVPEKGGRFFLVTTNIGSDNSSFDASISGMRWSVIDTALNGGNGDIITGFIDKPVRVPLGTEKVNIYDSAVYAGEGITAIPHCDGKRHWLITGSGNSVASKKVHVFLSDTNGVFYHHSDSMPTANFTFLSVNASRDGNFVCISGHLFTFNRVSGKLSYQKNLNAPGVRMLYSEFSPSSNALYTIPLVDDTMTYLYQTDLRNSSFPTTKLQLKGTNRVPQLGPDDKIYIAQYDEGYLSVIEFPDSINTQSRVNACGFRQDAVSIDPTGIGMLSKIGLPNMIDALNPSDLGTDFSYQVDQCYTYKFKPDIACSAFYIWNFGDGDTSHSFWPEHIYENPGTYTVTLITDDDTTTKVIYVGMNVSKPLISGAETICDTSKLRSYSISNFGDISDSLRSFTWVAYDGHLSGRPGQSNMEVKWDDEGRVTVIYQDFFGCTDSSWLEVGFADSSISNNVISKSNYYFCDSAEIITLTGTTPLGGVGGFQYRWYEKETPGGPWMLINGEYNDTLFNAISSRYYYRKVISDGCEHNSNTLNPSVPYIIGNTISVPHSYCTLQTITGSDPDSAYRYFWKVRRPGSTGFASLPVYTLNFTPIDSNEIYEYCRVAYLDSVACYNHSNIVRITPFSRINAQVSPNTSPCGIVSSGSNLDSISGIRYIWQRSTDSAAWTDQTNDTLKSINHNSSLSNFYFYRRKAYLSTTCFAYSNVILTNGLKVRIQPVNRYVCAGGASNDSFSFVLYNEKAPNLRYRWEFKYPNGSNWIGAAVTTRKFSASVAYQYGSNTSVRCIIMNNCDTINTIAVLVKIMSPLDTFTQQPSLTYSVAIGANLNIVAKITRPTDKTYQWQSSHNNGTTWFDLAGQNKDTLKIKNASRCHHKRTYRLKTVNVCGTVKYSDTANVTVTGTGLNIINQDYWMRDQWTDNGNEPNSNGHVVMSPDVFVAHKAYTTRPKALKYHPSGDAPNNYIHAMIKNKGSDSAKGGYLYFYWTVGATGEKWPLNWTNKQIRTYTGSSYITNYVNYHNNSDSLNNGDFGYFPLGAQINAEPIALPAIKNGDSVLLSYRWDRIPKAEWYKGIRTDQHKGINICLLARIQTCDETPFGMTYPEVENVKVNAQNNNNIVTRNWWINFMSPINGNNGKGGTDEGSENDEQGEQLKILVGKNRPVICGGHTVIRNMPEMNVTQKLCIKTSGSTYFNKAEAYIALDDSLYSLWVAGGSSLSGLTDIGNKTFKITSTTACLNGIATNAGFESGFRTYFVYLDKTVRFNDEETYQISIEQLGISDFLEGEVVFQLMDNPFVPSLDVSDSTMTVCDWDMLGGQVSYTVPNSSLPYTIFDTENEEYIELNETGTYTLIPGDYLIVTNDEPNQLRSKVNLTVSSAMPTNINIHDTVWYNCEYPDSVDYVKSCENGVMYDRYDQVVNESSLGHYTLDPQGAWYTFVCADSINCIKYSTMLTFRDLPIVPASTSNYLTGIYNRNEHPCCFVDLTEVECDGETPLVFGQEIEVYNMDAELLYKSNLELYGGTVLGFRFCPPDWDTSSSVISDWYSIVIRNDECSYCRMDFMCDSVGDPEPFVILNYPSGKTYSGIKKPDIKIEDKEMLAVENNVKAEKLPASISVYPNPASTLVNMKAINVNAESLNILICDATGKTVFANIYKTVNGNLSTGINTSDFASGVYTIYIPELNYYYKLIIIK